MLRSMDKVTSTTARTPILKVFRLVARKAIVFAFSGRNGVGKTTLMRRSWG